MKILAFALVAFLPLHALIITTLKCKFGMNTDIFRFWKEIIIIILFVSTVFKVLTTYKWNIAKLYKNNYILGMVTAFTLFSFIFIFLPYGTPKISGFLGFKYDVFFLFALVIGLYLKEIKENLTLILKIVFGVSITSLSVFLIWYLVGDIASTSSFFGFSDKPSTYNANSCISFSQNVENGQHRFQGSFAGPIRGSVFMSILYAIFLGYILNFLQHTSSQYFVKIKNKKREYSHLTKGLIIIPSLIIFTAIFYSYSKTSLLGLIFLITLFGYFTLTIVYKIQLTKKHLSIGTFIAILPIIGLFLLKKDVFLHLGSMINRLDNLSQSIEMFLYNPFGYGLGIAGPASWIGHSIESAGDWHIAVISTETTHKFLPENWYVQILLEQGLIGLGVFVGVLFVIGLKLYDIMKKRKDFFSIGLFTAYITLLFMANFTHAFEESATSYLLFLIIGAYISQNYMIKRHYKKKKK